MTFDLTIIFISVSDLFLSKTTMSRYDLVIYGASGFTGQYVIEFLHKAAVEHNLSWAVAGEILGSSSIVL